ncbi:hypothetical protein TNCV_3256561 [Trichonephila clavipes]|nr:hypothetical protein TNCV_3256561 [Trichonephila clavipes]
MMGFLRGGPRTLGAPKPERCRLRKIRLRLKILFCRGARKFSVTPLLMVMALESWMVDNKFEPNTAEDSPSIEEVNLR